MSDYKIVSSDSNNRAKDGVNKLSDITLKNINDFDKLDNLLYIISFLQTDYELLIILLAESGKLPAVLKELDTNSSNYSIYDNLTSGVKLFNEIKDEGNRTILSKVINITDKLQRILFFLYDECNTIESIRQLPKYFLDIKEDYKLFLFFINKISVNWTYYELKQYLKYHGVDIGKVLGGYLIGNDGFTPIDYKYFELYNVNFSPIITDKIGLYPSFKRALIEDNMSFNIDWVFLVDDPQEYIKEQKHLPVIFKDSDIEYVIQLANCIDTQDAMNKLNISDINDLAPIMVKLLMYYEYKFDNIIHKDLFIQRILLLFDFFVMRYLRVSKDRVTYAYVNLYFTKPKLVYYTYIHFNLIKIILGLTDEEVELIMNKFYQMNKTDFVYNDKYKNMQLNDPNNRILLKMIAFADRVLTIPQVLQDHIGKPGFLSLFMNNKVLLSKLDYNILYNFLNRVREYFFGSANIEPEWGILICNDFYFKEIFRSDIINLYNHIIKNVTTDEITVADNSINIKSYMNAWLSLSISRSCYAIYRSSINNDGSFLEKINSKYLGSNCEDDTIIILSNPVGVKVYDAHNIKTVYNTTSLEVDAAGNDYTVTSAVIYPKGKRIELDDNCGGTITVMKLFNLSDEELEEF